MKVAERLRAITLRVKGRTYKEIQQEISVSKGSLSRWLGGVEHETSEPTKTLRRLTNARTGKILHERKVARVTRVMAEAASQIPQISPSDLHLLGVMAYWAEGSKTQDAQVAFTNTDPGLILLVLRWWMDVCGIKRERIRLHIRVHHESERVQAEKYWQTITEIPPRQCYKTTLKVSGSSGARFKRTAHGIATIKLCDTDFHYRIKGWISGVCQQAALNRV